MRIDRHQKILNVLSKVAEEVEPVASARIAAAVVLGRDIVSIGVNRKKTHPFQLEHSKNPHCVYMHAENNAILNASKLLKQKDWNKASLYVCRVKWTDQWKIEYTTAMACPCRGCWSAIRLFQLKKVVYTNDNGSYNTVSGIQ